MKTLRDILSNIKSPKTSLYEGLLAGQDRFLNAYDYNLKVIKKEFPKLKKAFNDFAKNIDDPKYKIGLGHRMQYDATKLLNCFDFDECKKGNKYVKDSYTGLEIYIENTFNRYHTIIKLYDYHSKHRFMMDEISMILGDTIIETATEKEQIDLILKVVFKDADTFINFLLKHNVVVGEY